jgi:DNA-binding NtrC family response regulator
MNKKLSILIVDDEEIVSKRLKPALEKHGYEVEAQQTGKDALTSIAGKEFDIVITDMRIDEITGLQVLEAARKKSRNTKVILITGYATMELAREALTKGAFEVIAKPFRPEELREAIGRAASPAKAAGARPFGIRF